MFYLLGLVVLGGYGLAIARVLMAPFGGEDRFPTWLRVLIDGVAVVFMPLLITLTNSDVSSRLAMDLTVVRGIIVVAVVAYLLLSYRSGPWPPLLEWLGRSAVMLGLLVNVGLIVSDYFMAVGCVPIIGLFCLTLWRAHQQVIGTEDQLPSPTYGTALLDDFRPTTDLSAASYPYSDPLARALRWPATLVFPVLLLVAGVAYAVLLQV